MTYSFTTVLFIVRLRIPHFPSYGSFPLRQPEGHAGLEPLGAFFGRDVPGAQGGQLLRHDFGEGLVEADQPRTSGILKNIPELFGVFFMERHVKARSSLSTVCDAVVLCSVIVVREFTAFVLLDTLFEFVLQHKDRSVVPERVFDEFPARLRMGGILKDRQGIFKAACTPWDCIRDKTAVRLTGGVRRLADHGHVFGEEAGIGAEKLVHRSEV